MARRRKKRHKGPDEVELNLAAMLDMAFQLLAFFILTFKPSPVEGQIALRLPPPQPVTQVADAQNAGNNDKNTDPIAGLNSLIISVYSNANGGMAELAIGERTVPNLPVLERDLKTVFADPGSPFDQVIIQVDSALRYEELMRVIDVCSRQTLADGTKLSKLSFAELGAAPQ